jgi:hypothetical protein
MGAHGADKLLQDVQTYHDMHHEIVRQKMHQITQPRTGGRYGERPCGNPQCSECPKPRHIAVGFSSSRQQATILTGNEEQGLSPAPSAASSQAAEVDKQSSSPMSADSSPPRRIAAMTPPRIVAAPSDLFNNGTPANLFISPHFKKWDPIADDRREKTPVDNEDYTHMIPGGLNRLLKRQGEQNNRDMQDILGHTERKAKKSAKERQQRRGCSQSSRNKEAGKHSTCSRVQGTSKNYAAHTSLHRHRWGSRSRWKTGTKRLGRVVQKTRTELALRQEDHQRSQR